jgi:hypothetical protein
MFNEKEIILKDCSVCKENKKEQDLEKMKCSDKHIVCKDCWKNIKNRKCPICRKKQ